MHTPGKWIAIAPRKKGKHWSVCQVGSLGGKGAIGRMETYWKIVTVDNGAPGDTLDTEAANARLIAAAPDLLAACKQMIALGDLRNELSEEVKTVAAISAMDAMRIAVAKAESA